MIKGESLQTLHLFDFLLEFLDLFVGLQDLLGADVSLTELQPVNGGECLCLGNRNHGILTLGHADELKRERERESTPLRHTYNKAYKSLLEEIPHKHPTM